MKKVLIILSSIILFSSCTTTQPYYSISLVENQDVQIPSSEEKEYTLTFKFAEIYTQKSYVVDAITGECKEEYKETLKEVEETATFTFTYTYLEDYIITKDDYEEIYKDVNKQIPINNGGYYTFRGFYDDLEMNQDLNFDIGFKVDKNYTFYYTMIGGSAIVPTGTFKLNIIGEHNSFEVEGGI